jgi:hypothetical protein
LAERGVEALSNVRFDTSENAIRLEDAGQPGSVTWRLVSPYVFVGGKATAGVQLGAGASAAWRYSAEGDSWQTVAEISEDGHRTLEASIDDIVSPRGHPTYEFRLQLVLTGDAQATEVAMESDIQTSVLSLPELEVGTNPVLYTDDNEGERDVRITHQWLERAEWHPPSSPAEAIRPNDGATVAGTRVSFEWSAAEAPDGDSIVDYHFELSRHADMRWPLSPNFERLTSLTASRGKPEWTVPYVGLLNPNTAYYWRVRAKDAKGVWGPWSATFEFQARAPGVPLDLRLEPNETGSLVLHWCANPQGDKASSYKVYGSNEKGFSASDTPYPVFRGRGFCQTMDQFEGKPANAPDAGLIETSSNLLTTLRQTHLPVVGPELDMPNANCAYYRVVAVSEAGIESGPSDYAEVRRPFIWNHPNPIASVGEPYQWEPALVRSIGDLRCRRSKKSSYNAAFWDREEHGFVNKSLPPGLSQDPVTGMISGRPTEAGEFELSFVVSDQFGKTREFSFAIRVES